MEVWVCRMSSLLFVLYTLNNACRRGGATTSLTDLMVSHQPCVMSWKCQLRCFLHALWCVVANLYNSKHIYLYLHVETYMPILKHINQFTQTFTKHWQTCTCRPHILLSLVPPGRTGIGQPGKISHYYWLGPAGSRVVKFQILKSCSFSLPEVRMFRGTIKLSPL